MINKIISYIILFSVVLNIPSILLKTSSISFSSPYSYFIFLLLFVLILINIKFQLNQLTQIFLFISTLYFVISFLNIQTSISIYIIQFIKFFLMATGLSISIKLLDYKLFLYLLFFGCSMILFDAIFFKFNDLYTSQGLIQYGRYSGFYLNPNIAAYFCSIGYVLSLTKIKKYKYLFLIFFTFLGLLTLSRTFIFSWVLINIIYLRFNSKHFIYGLIFTLLLPILLFYAQQLDLEINRYSLLFDFINTGYIDYDVLLYDTRDATWAYYYNSILNAPILGNGFHSFLGINNQMGVHNTFLLILGESGIIPFLLFVI